MRYIDQTVVEGFICGVLFTALPTWFVLDSVRRVETALQQRQEALQQTQETIDELSRELAELRLQVKQL